MDKELISTAKTYIQMRKQYSRPDNLYEDDEYRTTDIKQLKLVDKFYAEIIKLFLKRFKLGLDENHAYLLVNKLSKYFKQFD